MLLLSSCGGKAVNTVLPAAPVPAASQNAVSLDRLDIDGIMFNDFNNGQKVEYTITELINEFKSFISGQVYNVTDVEWDKSYIALLLDNDNRTILEITFGARSATFDRDVEIGGGHYEKDKTYDTGGWINEYMMQFIRGAVLNPVHISYPAKLRNPGGYYTTEMLNDGSLVINQYETLPALHAFIDGSLTGKDIEISGSERLFSIEIHIW